MAGVKGRSGRPGGNPELQEHQFKAPEGKEPNTEKLSVRIPKSMDEALNQLPDRNQFVRDAITSALQKATSFKSGAKA